MGNRKIGRTVSMGQDSKVKKPVEYKIEGIGRKRRLKFKWNDAMDVKEMNFKKCKGLAINRKQWRLKVKEAKALNRLQKYRARERIFHTNFPPSCTK